MDYTTDTIAAMATPSGEGGIAIVRLSGPDTFRIIQTIFTPTGKPFAEREPNTFAHGHIMDESCPIDEVLVLIMRSPKSYTCEDMVEIQGHGGRISAQRILHQCTQHGARLAEPGEFTKRAFMNGRIDLLQAEAVGDLIHARSERAATIAMEQLRGGLSATVNTLYDDVLKASTNLEVSLDFSEEDICSSVIENCTSCIMLSVNRLDNLLKSWTEGHVLREGASVVIIGNPNTGKSTLLNALLQQDRAIVTDQPGTTRDTLEESFVLQGIPIRLIDTAGIRETNCAIEKEGISRTRRVQNSADILLFLIDASQPLDGILEERIAQCTADKTLFIINKKKEVFRRDGITAESPTGTKWV